MFEQLLLVMLMMFFISLVSFSGSAQYWFYELGVVRSHWLSPTDFTSFLAFGFATPGPQVYSIATFIGYREAGFAGAIGATIVMYAMSCLLALVVTRYLKSWLQSENAEHFVLGVGLAAAGLLIAAGLKLLQPQTVSVGYLAIALGAFAARLRHLNTISIIIAAGLLGLLLH